MKLNKYIDHTILSANASYEDIERVAKEAIEHDFASVCINSGWIPTVAEMLNGTDVKVCTVVGFPLGANSIEVKALETKYAVENGADEIDMVINVGAVKSKDWLWVKYDIEGVLDSAKGRVVKVILETGLLTEDEIIKVCEICRETKVDFVKTSTGFGPRGASVEDVKLMKKVFGREVEASGGIRNLEDAKKMIEAGATRIGTSGGVAIVKGEDSKENY